MTISSAIKLSINQLFIFTSINDKFVVDTFGEMSLKFVLLLFLCVNLNTIMSFKGWSKQNLPFLCLLISMLLTLFINWHQYVDVYQAINSLISILLIYTVFSQLESPRQFIWGYSISALFSAILCITSINTLGEYNFRKTGGMGDPNEFSVTILIPLCFLSGYILRYRTKFNIILIITVLLYIISLLLAGSKSAMITFCLIVFFVICYLIFVYSGEHKIKIFVGTCCLLGVIFLILNQYYNDIFYQVLGRFENSGTANERLLSWKAGIRLFESYPFFGIGICNYVNLIGTYNPTMLSGSRAAHNMYVQALVETGACGFLAYLWCLTRVLYRQYRYQIYSFEIFVCFLPILIMGGTLSLLYEKYVWIIIALLYNKNEIKNRGL